MHTKLPPMNRRRWLGTGLASASSLCGWTLAALPAHAAAPRDSGKRPPLLVVLMLRGAADGLNIVAPLGEPEYARARPRLALSASSDEHAALPLSTLFALHPALAPLMPQWQQGCLGFVHACGSPLNTRSHFDAQDDLETGTPGQRSTADGWLNRLLSELPGTPHPTRALQLGNTPARIFSGSASVAQLGLGPRALAPKAIDQPEMQAALAKLYAQDPQLADTYRDATATRAELRRHAAEMPAMAGPRGRDNVGGDPAADRGAASARGFAADAQRLGRLLQREPRCQIAFSAVGGWDTHANQGAAQGQLANRLQALAQGLDALAQGLGERWRDTALVVLSEFGRTLRENGTGGTDHGRANVAWLLGGAFAGGAGGRVLGTWPGLDSAALEQGRDLRVTTDFRHLLRPILRQHLGVNEATLARVFPDAPPDPGTLARQLFKA
ncbi:DUF1501 domain-containing protein [Roseateles sp. BYS180W]|uniref:DUF1501 domain-containing protein n=1 Tax=Roseateles rivi TaxID=3299028 RepID=A0ABW7FUA5_9BURK